MRLALSRDSVLQHNSKSEPVSCMEKKEIAVIEGVETADSFSTVHYDLHFMESRLVALHAYRKGTGAGYATGGLVGTLVGEGVERLKASRWKDRASTLSEMTLDERLASEKNNFSIPYSDIKKVKLWQVVFARNFKVKSKTLDKTFRLTKNQYETVRMTISKIPELLAKWEIGACFLPSSFAHRRQHITDYPSVSDACFRWSQHRAASSSRLVAASRVRFRHSQVPYLL